MWGFMGAQWQSTEGGHIIQPRYAPKRLFLLSSCPFLVQTNKISKVHWKMYQSCSNNNNN